MSIIGTVVFIFVAGLAGVILQFNRKRVYIAKVAKGLNEDTLWQIYYLIEECGSAQHNGYILARSNKPKDCLYNVIAIPKEIKSFPWAGKQIEISACNESFSFKFLKQTESQTCINGEVYFPVRVPRNKIKSGKLRNAFMPKKYLSINSKLNDLLKKICPKYPEELLSYLLCSGSESYEFDPINQARIGTSPSWLQSPEFRNCRECKQRMNLIVQIPGTMLATNEYDEGTVFLFGCRKHPDETSVVIQYT